MTNIGDREIKLPNHAILGLWVEGDMIPRPQGFVTVGSGKYKEWQTLAYEATTDRVNKLSEEQIGPLVDRPTYATPKCIMQRPSDALKDIPLAVFMVMRQAGDEELQRADTVVTGEGTINMVGSTPLNEVNLPPIGNDHRIKTQIAMRGDHGIEQGGQGNRLSSLDVDLADNRSELTQPEETKESEEESSPKIDETETAEAPVYYHESEDLFAEDIEQHLAVLPEMSTAEEEMTIDDIQIGDPNVPLTTDQQRLRSLIWKTSHLIIGKGNALLPASRGSIRDIDVGWAAPIAQRVR